MPGRSTIITSMLNQTAVYWANPVSDGVGGRTFDDPVEMSVRWEDRAELFLLRGTGEEVVSQAIVYAAVDVDIGGYLFLGTLADMTSAQEGDPMNTDDAREIRSLGKSPDIRASTTLRKVWL